MLDFVARWLRPSPMIRVQTAALVVTLPEPLQEIGRPSDRGTKRERTVTRKARVFERDEVTVIEFEAVPGSIAENGPFGGVLRTTVEWRPEVSSVALAKEHFLRAHGEAQNDRVAALSSAISIEKFGAFSLVTINSALAGFRPGGTRHCVVLERALGAFVFEPTYDLRFDWSRLRIEER